MTVPSLQRIKREALRTLKRFPLPILSAAIATGVAIFLVETDNPGTYTALLRVLLVSTLGISLLTAAAVTEEKRDLLITRPYALQTLGVLLLAGYYIWLSGVIGTDVARPYIRYTLLFIGSHLLVAIGPYIGGGQLNGFWQYNRRLFLHILKTLLYSTVLFIGLSVALISVDQLLEIEVDTNWYSHLWCLLIGLFNTWFFLAGVPADLDALDGDRSYPRGLKIFTQYVMVPLMIIYVIILYAYSIKILWNQVWPVSWVTYLVLSFSGTGILSLLLLHPLRDREGHEWLQYFSRGYYISLIPLVILLLVAIARRISTYGVTENRYFVLVAGIWLGLTAVYYSITGAKNIKIIPGTLCICAFLISGGPWGALSVAERSQINRLRGMLTEHNILVDGQINPTDASVPADVEKEVSAVVRYLHRHHGYGRISRWFDEPLTVTEQERIWPGGSLSQWKEPSDVVRMMGLSYTSRWEVASKQNFSTDWSRPLNVEGYTTILQNEWVQAGRQPSEISVDDRTILLQLNAQDRTLVLRSKADSDKQLTIDLKPLIQGLTEAKEVSSNQVPRDMMSRSASSSFLSCKLYVRNLQLNTGADPPEIDHMRVDLLFRFEQ